MNNNYLDTTKVTLDPVEGDTEEVLRLKLIALDNSSRRDLMVNSGITMVISLWLWFAVLHLVQSASDWSAWTVIPLPIALILGFLIHGLIAGVTTQKAYKLRAEGLSSALDLVVEPQLADKS